MPRVSFIRRQIHVASMIGNIFVNYRKCFSENECNTPPVPENYPIIIFSTDCLASSKIVLSSAMLLLCFECEIRPYGNRIADDILFPLDDSHLSTVLRVTKKHKLVCFKKPFD